MDAIIGRQNRAAGAMFEKMIEAACDKYRAAGAAEIEKTPEAMRTLSKQNARGQFMACFTKKAQPDFKGTLAPAGRSVVFEAKFTATGKMRQEAVTEEQAAALTRHAKLGAECFVLVSFGFEEYFKIPWEVWREIKKRYGHKYITAKEAQKYKVKMIGGTLDFLRNFS